MRKACLWLKKGLLLVPFGKLVRGVSSGGLVQDGTPKGFGPQPVDVQFPLVVGRIPKSKTEMGWWGSMVAVPVKWYIMENLCPGSTAAK